MLSLPWALVVMLKLVRSLANLTGCVLQYSFSLTTFSPSGKLVQIEYALNAVAAGSTSLGIKVQEADNSLNPFKRYDTVLEQHHSSNVERHHCTTRQF